MGRPTQMSDPEARRQLAELLSRGETRENIAEVFGVHKDTITEWRKRADVQALVSKFVEERSNRILSKVDNKLEGILSQVDKLSLEDLLKIRREFAAAKSETTIRVDSAGALEDLMEQVAADPALAAALLGTTADAADHTGD